MSSKSKEKEMLKLFSFLAVVASLVITLGLVAQDKEPKIAPLTKDEVIHLRTLQLNESRTADALNRAIQQLPQYAAHQQALAELQNAGSKVFTDRKLTGDQAALCDGPTQGVQACANVKPGEVELLPTQTAKPEAKK